ncbi:MAG: hypothetical protein ACYC1I_08445 [Acidimicrobiales bacterium]
MPSRRVISAGVVLAVGVGYVTIGHPISSTSIPRSASKAAREPMTRATLLSIAVRFNRDYQTNDVAAVYDRWDNASRAVISRSDYIRRHIECPSAPGPAVVESASPISNGYWRVRYEISGIQLTDYWHYVSGRWCFDLLRSNPDAVRLYKLPFTAYASAIGCISP